jgi:hypothetical protein
MMLKRHPARLLAGVFIASLAAHAQTAPAGPAHPATGEPTLELSPFVVRNDRDEGWVAATSLVGNRTNTEISQLPMTVDVLTSEFMRDLGAFTLEDAARWVANVDVVSSHETAAEEQRVNFRGMQLGGREVSQASRNFFPWFTPTDAYNVDRIDFSKGSNSLMFGDSIPGGMATSYTKRARPQNFGVFTALYGSFDSYRVQLDINRKITDKLAVRVNLVDRDDKSYLQYAHSSLRAGHLALTYRAFEHTQFRFDGETGKFERRRASNLIRIRPNSAPGRGFSTANRWFVTSDGQIVQTPGTLSTIDRSAAGGTAVSLMEGQSAIVNLMNSTTVASGQTVAFEGYDREINLRGTTDFLDRPFYNYTGYLEHQAGKLNLELAVNFQKQEQDRTDPAFDSTISVDRNGRPYIDTAINRREFGDRVRIIRATASYPFEFGKWTKQYLVVSAETQEDELFNFRENLANFAAADNGPVPIANHQVLFRAYLDDPRFPSPSFWEQFRPENLPTTATFRPDWYDTTTADLPFIDIRSSRSANVSLAGSYWKDRIHSIIGARYDKFSRKRITDLPTDALGQYIFLGGPDVAPDAYEYDPQFDLDNTSYAGGLTWEVVPEVNLYGTYTESFRWAADVDFTGTALGPVLGATREVGIKTSFFKRKLFATLGFYRTDRANTRYVWTPNDLSAAELEDLFNPNNLAPSSPDYFHPAEGANDEFRTVTATERAEGFETTWQLQRMGGFQARLTYSRNNIEVLRDFAKFETMYNAAVARTSAALAPGGNPALAENITILNDGRNILEANRDVQLVTGSRSAKNIVSWVVDYQFARTSSLRGTRVAVYGNWHDDYNLTLLNGILYRGGATHPVGAYVIHQHKIAGVDTSFRLGVRNIVDLENNDTMRITAIVAADANGVPTNYQYRYLDPVVADVSVTVRF